VNNVWYIKILSPLEVQQMGKGGSPSTSAPGHKLSTSGNSCDNYASQQELRSSRNGMASMGSFHY